MYRNMKTRYNLKKKYIQCSKQDSFALIIGRDHGSPTLSSHLAIPFLTASSRPSTRSPEPSSLRAAALLLLVLQKKRGGNRTQIKHEGGWSF